MLLDAATPFNLFMAVISFSFGLSRPPSNNLVLEQVDKNAGAASSLLIFIYFMLGAFSMWLISLDWTDKSALSACWKRYAAESCWASGLFFRKQSRKKVLCSVRMVETVEAIPGQSRFVGVVEKIREKLSESG
ncbi:MAG: hypothetical protein PF482_14645 [Desulfobacteraceae bacterium]|jgi:hypothetical protein|nr:hypothetical protein [Desulfobacteraceae bacterium]